MHEPRHDHRGNDNPSRKRSNRDLFAALASGFVGALALASSIYNVYLQRQQVRAQVLPRVEWNVHWTGESWVLGVSNQGVGPADVKRMRVFVDDHPAQNWLDAEKALLGGNHTSLGLAGNVIRTLSPGQNVAALTLGEPELAREMFAERRRLGVELCYCSTLEDCWVVAGHGLASELTVQVGSCAPDPVPFAMFDEQALDDYVRSLTPGLRTPRWWTRAPSERAPPG